jgi:hypothetical protein
VALRLPSFKKRLFAADYTMWNEALNASAIDCCFDDDVPAICRAILQTGGT